MSLNLNYKNKIKLKLNKRSINRLQNDLFFNLFFLRKFFFYFSDLKDIFIM